MRRSNVLPFPPSDSGGGLNLKGYAILFYLLVALSVAWILPVTEYLPMAQWGLMWGVLPVAPSPSGLFLLFTLMLLYNFFVRQKAQHSPYFRRNKTLLLILLGVAVFLFFRMALVVLFLVLFYWLLVVRTGREAPYFLRFHVLTSLFLNFFILMPLLILHEIMGLLGTLSVLAALDAVLGPVFLLYAAFLPWIMLGLFVLPALWLSLSVLMGRTPYIALVTAGVRQLA